MRPLKLLAAVVALAGCGPAPPATFTMVNTDVLKSSCAAFASCHNATGHMGSLDLQTNPYAAMVNVASTNTVAAGMGWKRVAPGDPSTSFVYQKLVLPNGTDGPGMANHGLGDRMPQSNSSLDQS